MTDERSCPVVDFDHNSPAHAVDPDAAYRRLREEAPVAWTDAHGGYWVLSSYDTVFAAARDDDTFSSARNEYGGEGLTVVIPKSPMHQHIPIEMDPPQFKPYRRILNPLTTPAAAAEMQEMVDGYVTRFIDDIIEDGQGDFASVIGVPAAVTIDWLGLDVSEWKRYSDVIHATLTALPGSPEMKDVREVGMPWMQQRVRDGIAARADKPADDVISYLLAQEIDGRLLTQDEVFSYVELLISGGVGTTASLVGQTLVYLSEHPDVRQQLIDDPDLLAIALEEFLRVFSPVQALARTIMQDAEAGGCPVHEGERALLSWASANRDGEVFENPEAVDLTRWPNRHLAFGAGVHRCAGSHIARVMARAMITQVLERMPDYEVDREGLEAYPNQGVNKGWQRIPVRFTPGKRVLDRSGDVVAAGRPAR